MDFSACVISEGFGRTPVKLGDSSFSVGLQIKQSCLAKQNPLQSYFPPSVWPDKIQGNHFNPEAFPDQETLDQSDWRKGPINTLSRPFLKLSTSSAGVSEKLHLTLRSLPAGELLHKLRAPRPVWATFLNWKHLCLLFLPTVWVRHISPILTTSWVPTSVQDLPSHLPDILPHTGAVFTCCQCLPESSSCSLPACCLFRRLQRGRLSSARLQWQGPQGLMEGLCLTILFQRGPKRTKEHPSPAAWMEIQHQLGSVRPVSTGKPRIMASTATPSSVTPLSSLAASPPFCSEERLLCDKSQNISRSQMEEIE